MQGQQLRCATWNVHRAKGGNGRVDPVRVVDAIAQVLAPLGLDIMALQEAAGDGPPHAGILDVHRTAEVTGLTYVHDPALRWGPHSDGFLGTILFLSPSLQRTHADIIDLPGHCHRGAVSVETLCENRPLRIISTHLSLFQPLRIVQMRILGQYLYRRKPMQTILLGDLNEWRPWGGLMLHRSLVGTRFRGPVRRTFPANQPFLPLDRILTDAPGTVQQMRAITAPETTAASDHLPLEAIVTVP